MPGAFLTFPGEENTSRQCDIKDKNGTPLSLTCFAPNKGVNCERLRVMGDGAPLFPRLRWMEYITGSGVAIVLEFAHPPADRRPGWLAISTDMRR